MRDDDANGRRVTNPRRPMATLKKSVESETSLPFHHSWRDKAFFRRARAGKSLGGVVLCMGVTVVCVTVVVK